MEKYIPKRHEEFVLLCKYGSTTAKFVYGEDRKLYLHLGEISIMAAFVWGTISYVNPCEPENKGGRFPYKVGLPDSDFVHTYGDDARYLLRIVEGEARPQTRTEDPIVPGYNCLRPIVSVNEAIIKARIDNIERVLGIAEPKNTQPADPIKDVKDAMLLILLQNIENNICGIRSVNSFYVDRYVNATLRDVRYIRDIIKGE